MKMLSRAAISTAAVMMFAQTAAGQGANVTPELFAPGVISTPLDELNAAFTPDMKTVYFSINAPNSMLGTLVESRLENGRWTLPVVLPFSGQYTDYDPFVTQDGKRVFFISNRPKERGAPYNPQDFDIWVVDRLPNSRWGEPQNIGAPVNTTRPEYYPSVATDGTLYFSTNRDGGQGAFDVYRARFENGRYAEPENLGPNVNGRTSEIDNYVAPDQSFIVFASYNRQDDTGRGDLYISFRNPDGSWTPAKNLGAPINSSAREYCPIGSPDGKYFYWTSMRGFADRPQINAFSFRELRDRLNSIENGQGNIYRIPLSYLLSKRNG